MSATMTAVAAVVSSSPAPERARSPAKLKKGDIVGELIQTKEKLAIAEATIRQLTAPDADKLMARFVSVLGLDEELELLVKVALASDAGFLTLMDYILKVVENERHATRLAKDEVKYLRGLFQKR